MASNDSSKVNVLMVGTGEYTTGYVGGHGFPEEYTNDEAMKQIVDWILQ